MRYWEFIDTGYKFPRNHKLPAVILKWTCTAKVNLKTINPVMVFISLYCLVIHLDFGQK